MHPPPPRRRRLLWSLLAALSLLAAVACTDAGGQTTAGGGEGEVAGAEGEVAAGGQDRSPAPPTPDVLEDPGVAPGECGDVVYTPPTAEDEHSGHLCRPEEDQRDVAVVLIHGGSGVSGAPGTLEGWRRRLNAEGYVTFQISYHLFSEGSGESPVFPLPEQNVKAAVQRLRGSGNALGIAKDRIAVQGHSAGARIGAVAYTTAGDAWFEGDELWPDVPDEVDAFVGFYHPYDGTMQYASQYFGGSDRSEDPTVQLRLAKADALGRADEADDPALFITGDRDWEVIDEQQEDFADALQEDGQEARSIIIEDGAHGFDLGGSRLTRLGEEAATHVLEFYNDVFPQDPAREAQSADVDLSKAPRGTGTPPTTAATRYRSGSSYDDGYSSSQTTWGSYSTSSTTWYGGESSSTTYDATTTVPVDPTTTATTTAPTSSTPPSTSPTSSTPTSAPAPTVP